jgi:hypothetical protein
MNKNLMEYKIPEWITIPEKGIQIQKETHFFEGNTFSDAKKDKKENEFLPTYELLQWLRNNEKYCKLLNLESTWEFIEQQDNELKAKGIPAVFISNPKVNEVGIGNIGGAVTSDAMIQIRFVRVYDRPLPEFYKKNICCDNCGWSNTVDIPKEVSIHSFMKYWRAMCEYCGCQFYISNKMGEKQ